MPQPTESQPPCAPRVTPAQVAAHLGCSENHVRGLMRRGRIRSVRDGSRYKTTWADVQAYLESIRTVPDLPPG